MRQKWSLFLASARASVLPYPYIMKQTPTRQVRKSLQLTQAKFAEKLGVAKQTVVDIEGRRKGYQDRIPLRLAKRIGFLSGMNPLSLVDQKSGTPKPLGEAKAETRKEDEDSGLKITLTPGVARHVASAMIAAESLGVREGQFLAFEIEDLIMSHVSAWGIRNAPAGVFAPALRNQEARRREDAMNLAPVMSMHTVAVARFRRQFEAAGFPAKDLDLLAPYFLIQLAEEFTSGTPEGHLIKRRPRGLDQEGRARLRAAAAALQDIARFLTGKTTPRKSKLIRPRKKAQRAVSGHEVGS